MPKHLTHIPRVDSLPSTEGLVEGYPVIFDGLLHVLGADGQFAPVGGESFFAGEEPPSDPDQWEVWLDTSSDPTWKVWGGSDWIVVAGGAVGEGDEGLLADGFVTVADVGTQDLIRYEHDGTATTVTSALDFSIDLYQNHLLKDVDGNLYFITQGGDLVKTDIDGSIIWSAGESFVAVRGLAIMPENDAVFVGVQAVIGNDETTEVLRFNMSDGQAAADYTAVSVPRRIRQIVANANYFYVLHASMDSNATITQYAPEGGTSVNEIAGHSRPNSAHASEDGQHLVVGYNGYQSELYDAETLAELVLMSSEDRIMGVRIRDDALYIADGGIVKKFSFPLPSTADWQWDSQGDWSVDLGEWVFYDRLEVDADGYIYAEVDFYGVDGRNDVLFIIDPDGTIVAEEDLPAATDYPAIAVRWGALSDGATTLELEHSASAPESTPSNGGTLFVQDGALFYRGGNGTITEIAEA